MARKSNDKKGVNGNKIKEKRREEEKNSRVSKGLPYKDIDEIVGPITIKANKTFTGTGHIKLDTGHIKLDPSFLRYAVPSNASSIGSYYTPIVSSGSLIISPASVLTLSPERQQLEDEVAGLKKENTRLARDVAEAIEAKKRKIKEIGELKQNVEELTKKQRLKRLLDRVNEYGQKKLLECEDFRNLFEESDSCTAIIMAVDIRRSTELMLKAREAELYADFIMGLCTQLRRITVDNFGVFDKFTGDGILAFFPDFYTGSDAPYWALKAASECHTYFRTHYQQNRKCFNSVLMDVGLGIGIDYGKSYLVKMQDELTVIGSPVVYACRLSGAPAGETLLNQPAYEEVSEKYYKHVNLEESEIPVKNEGRTLAYRATLSDKAYKPKPPVWP